MGKVIRWAGLVVLAALAGCATPRTERCLMPGVAIAILPKDQIDRACFALTGSMINDSGAAFGVGEKSRGCAVSGIKNDPSHPPTIVIPDPSDTEVLVHELRHLMAWACGEKAP